MVRKHTRRAVKAAFAISFGVALLIGITVTGSAGAAKMAKPTLTIGTKNFGEEYILGYLYGEALAAKGFPVVYKGSFGNSEEADAAIRSGKMNFYPEYTGIIALDLAQKPSADETFPHNVQQTYDAAEQYENTHHLTLLHPTPFVDTDTVTVLSSTAKAHNLNTIADLAKLKSFSYAGYPECKKRVTCLVGLQKIYKLQNVHFVSLGSISVYTLLDNHQVTSGDGFSTDPQKASSKYTTLRDTKHIFGFENVAPVLTEKLVNGPGGAQLKATCNKVSSLLTVKAMRSMDAAYYNGGSAQQIAHDFLKANGMVK